MSMKFEALSTIDQLLVEAEHNCKTDYIEALNRLDSYRLEFLKVHADVNGQREVWKALLNDEIYIALHKSVSVASYKYTNVCNALLQFEYEYGNFEVK